MATPFVPRLVVSRFMHAVLSSDGAVQAALAPSGVIVPDEGIPTNVVLTLAQTFSGGVSVAKRMGAPIAQVGLHWDLTGWVPTYSRKASEPLMLAAMAVLIGPETKGRTHYWVDTQDSRAWAIDVDAADDLEQPVRLDESTPQVWAPVRHRYRVALRPRG